MNGEVIKSFLVGLGFEVDSNSLAKFNKAIQTATARVTALYVSVQLAAAGIFKAISGISEGFEQMGYELRLVAPAINKALLLRQAMIQAYRAAGINLQQAIQQSIRFNFSLTKTKFALEAIYKSVGLRFLPMLTKQMDIFRAQIYKNMPKIQASLEHFVQFVFKAFQATLELGQRLWSVLGRVYDFFVALDGATGGWSTNILAFAAAWKVLNLEFLATPLGAIIAGFVALLALYDDFKTQQEGGKSLFDWNTDGLKNFRDAFIEIEDAGKTLLSILKAIKDGKWDIVTEKFKGLAEILFHVGESIGAGIAAGIKNSLDGLLRYLVLGSEDEARRMLSASPNINNPLFNPANFSQPTPVNPNSAGSINQNLRSQTTINVQGSADPNATAGAVAAQQNGVNRNLVRNMKPGAQ